MPTAGRGSGAEVGIRLRGFEIVKGLIANDAAQGVPGSGSRELRRLLVPRLLLVREDRVGLLGLLPGHALLDPFHCFLPSARASAHFPTVCTIRSPISFRADGEIVSSFLTYSGGKPVSLVWSR
jgi:hypothetical protein